MRNSTRGRLLLSITILVRLCLGGRPDAWWIPSRISRDLDALIVNEFLAANQAGMTDQDGDHSDWIELYNPGRRAIRLAGWSLTDDRDRPDKWAFPDRTLGSHEYLLVFASGKDRRPAQPGSELHANFRLSRKGEFLGLYSTLGRRFVSVPLGSDGDQFPEQFSDVSYGRRRSGEDASVAPPTYGYLAMSTPGQPNDGTFLWDGLVAPVRFGRERGFYETPFTLELATTTPNATIRYTTDGSEPTETHGTRYAGPISITTTTVLRAAAFKPGLRASPVDTHTYILIDQVLAQPPDPPGFRKTWGAYGGSPVPADYEMDPDVVNDPRYSGVMHEALRSIPTLSIVTDRQSLHDLYANPRQKGNPWERPASIEFLNASQQQQGFQINAGLRLQGELGRLETIPKHAFRLFFRGEYGAARLEYPLYPNSPVQEFDTLTLRSGVNRSYAGWPESDQKPTTYTRDEWLRASQIALSGSGSHGIFVHLYLNGLYWGLYNVVERPDEAFLSSYFGGSKDDWQAINHAEALDTSSERFKTLHRLAAEGQLDDPRKYAAISAYLDIPQFIDFLILNWYAGNLDWAFNNWYAGVRRSSGQVKYFVWDGERTWHDGAEIYMGMPEYEGRPNLIIPLYEALLENPDFRVELADRLYKHLSNEGALSDANAQARWIEINNTIERAIIAESARWGDTREHPPITQEDWFKARDDVLAQMEGNAARLISLARQAGTYPAIDPPLFSRHNNTVSAAKWTVSLLAPHGGTIYYTTDGSDPRVLGTGQVSPNAQRYSGPVTLAATARIKARVLTGDPSTPLETQAWSALSEAVFVSGCAQTPGQDTGHRSTALLQDLFINAKVQGRQDAR